MLYLMPVCLPSGQRCLNALMFKCFERTALSHYKDILQISQAERFLLEQEKCH